MYNRAVRRFSIPAPVVAVALVCRSMFRWRTVTDDAQKMAVRANLSETQPAFFDILSVVGVKSRSVKEHGIFQTRSENRQFGFGCGMRLEGQKVKL
jgi:hypothetical protein